MRFFLISATLLVLFSAPALAGPDKSSKGQRLQGAIENALDSAASAITGDDSATESEDENEHGMDGKENAREHIEGNMDDHGENKGLDNARDNVMGYHKDHGDDEDDQGGEKYRERKEKQEKEEH